MVRSVTAGDEVDQAAANTSTTPVSRVINLTERLDRSTKRFATDPEGLATSTVTFTIEEQRAVTIVEGTTGVNDCTIPDLAQGNCAIFADLLGEAVIWSRYSRSSTTIMWCCRPSPDSNVASPFLNGMRLSHALHSFGDVPRNTRHLPR